MLFLNRLELGDLCGNWATIWGVWIDRSVFSWWSIWGRFHDTFHDQRLWVGSSDLRGSDPSLQCLLLLVSCCGDTLRYELMHATCLWKKLTGGGRWRGWCVCIILCACVLIQSYQKYEATYIWQTLVMWLDICYSRFFSHHITNPLGFDSYSHRIPH